MKIYILMLPVIFLTIASCKKNDDYIFDKSPDQRIIEALAKYQKMLVDEAPNGWKAVITTKTNFTRSFYFQFNNSNRVKSIADIDTTAAFVVKESSYRLKALQQPSLIFDTYTYLHMLADPDDKVGGGERGAGYKSDFEFPFDDKLIKGDTLKMTGRYNSSTMTFVKATKAEADAYKAGKLNTIIKASTPYFSSGFTYLLYPNNEKRDVSKNEKAKTITTSYLESTGNIITFTSSFYYTLNGISLAKPLMYAGTAVNELLWDATEKLYYIVVKGTRINMQTSTTPVIPLHKAIGQTVKLVQVVSPKYPNEPTETTNPGSSQNFLDILYRCNQSSSTFAGGGSLALYPQLYRFAFNPAAKTMVLTIYFTQGSGTSPFQALFNFKYTKRESGVFKFTFTGFGNDNAKAIGNSMLPLLRRLAFDNFTTDYFRSPDEKLPQFTSVENPGFFFSTNIVDE